MSVFTGHQHKGAMRDHRTRKRQQAEARNAVTLPERRRAARDERALLVKIFAAPGGKP